VEKYNNGHTDNEKTVGKFGKLFPTVSLFSYALPSGCIYADSAETLSDDVRWKVFVYQSRAAILIEFVV